MFKRIKKTWSNIGDDYTIESINIGDVRYKIRLKSLSWDNGQSKLRGVISNGGYNPNNQEEPISISGDGICINGHHRLSCLLDYYDGDYTITVRKLKRKYRYIILISILTLILKPSLLKTS